ncbi:Major Intrinsic Protein (MIP) Family [Pseudoloma neurophilia]|uniref:Aquaporin n=1 Tax=Pseudoloma neurophilia TaxID=146866 RepID=A0A0R0LSF5_9MICR|nr:Major Intrinsic Protein (MIP) Family [Pseudoloma neurophilia]
MPTSFRISYVQTYFAEFICSFIFGFTVYSAIVLTTLKEMAAGQILIGVAIGFVSISIIWAFCDITVAHFNPAITFATVIFCKLPIIKGIFYIIAQGLGFMLAAVVVLGSFPGNWRQIMNIIRPKPADGVVTGEVICIEIFLTGILVFIVFCSAVNSYKQQKDKKNLEQLGENTSDIPDRTMFIPLIIGSTLGFLGLLGGSTSGGAFNPAIVWAPVLFSGVWRDSWKYWVGQFVGAFGAGVIQMVVFYPFN